MRGAEGVASGILVSMLILLPPSEAKAVGGVAPPADGGTGLSAEPALLAARRTVLRAVLALCRGDAAAAARSLRLPASVAVGALADNVALPDAPTLPALDRYRGVL